MDAPVAVIGGGVVGAAVAHALARRWVAATLVEAEDEMARGASGTNSGILHTGFDSVPGELETELILRSNKLRPPVLEELQVPVVPCGGRIEPREEGDRAKIEAIAAAAEANHVEASLGDDGALSIPGEAVTDPVAYTAGLAAAAADAGSDVRTGARVEAIEREREGIALRLADGGSVRSSFVVNCAGLRADEVARMVGDESFAIYPRKGEFFVFEPPGGVPLAHILLPIPTERTKGVLVFPTVDGKVVAGPTAHDQDDKDDWSVRPEAWGEVMDKVVRAHPPLEGAEPIASYAGLRPAGRDCNYVIAPSTSLPELVNVAAIRSTGLSASLGIGEHVAGLLAAAGLKLGPERTLGPVARPAGGEPWWRRAAAHESLAP
jgi:glycerol-3-phosphate dehydrogenase